MSRRRKPPAASPGSAPDAKPVYLVAVRCTDRLQHPRTAIALLGQFAGPDDRMKVLWKTADHPDPLTGWQEPDGSRTFLFACPRCDRHVELREKNVLAYMEAKRSTGEVRPVIDLSARAGPLS